MTANYNKKTQQYEVFDSQVGGMVPYPENHQLSYEDELKEMKQRGEYCGWCKSYCLVTSGEICCHGRVRYGSCRCPDRADE